MQIKIIFSHKKVFKRGPEGRPGGGPKIMSPPWKLVWSAPDYDNVNILSFFQIFFSEPVNMQKYNA